MTDRPWQHIINLGVTSTMPFSQQRGLRVFNMLAFTAIPLPPISTLIASRGYFQALPFISSILMSLAFFAILILNYKGLYSLAKGVYYTFSTFLILVHVFFYGLNLGAEFTFIPLFVSAFAFSNSNREMILFGVLSAAGYISCILIGDYFKPLTPVSASVYAQVTIIAIVLVLTFALLWMIKTQNEEHQQIIQRVNEQLYEQKEEIEAQNNKIVSTRNELEIRNTAITSSINYAQRIQQAILPSLHEIKDHFPNSFIYFKPRDIVSGDFYWHLHFYSKTYFAIADCTGHGVPGAFMSMLGSSLLNLVVQSTFADSPRLILKYMDLQLMQMLARGGADSREGMEITLGVYDKATNKLKIASTSRPFFRIRDGEITEYRGVKSFIGKSLFEKIPFEETVFEVNQGDSFYFFTDGITDQFDAVNKKKYSLKRLRSFLLDIHTIPMQQQLNLFEKEVEVWKGETPQTDDMLLMGVKF